MKKIVCAFFILSQSLEGFADDVKTPEQSPQELAHKIISEVQNKQDYLVNPSLTASISVLEKGTTQFPNDPQIYFALAECYTLQHNNPATLINIEKAYSLSLKNVHIGETYIDALVTNKQPLKAVETSKELLAMYPSDFALQQETAALEVFIQKYDDASAILEPLAQIPPWSLPDGDNETVLLNLGVCYLYEGHYSQAVDTFESLNKRYPPSVAVLTYLGETYIKSNNFEKGVSCIDQALSIAPDCPPTLFYKGVCLEKSGDLKAAQKSFEKAYALLKEFTDKNCHAGGSYYLLFQISQKLSKNDEASKYKAEAAQLLFTYEAPWKQK